MKKQIIVLLAFSAALPLFAQETNVHQKTVQQGEKPPRERPPWERRDGGEKGEHAEHKLKMMDRALDRIGVTEEERAEILKLQEEHRKIMKSNMERLKTARHKLSELQKSSATEAELDAAIDEVTGAQNAQLKTLVRNRMQMERILGKEKFDRFMEDARGQFQKQGRRGGGPGMPRRAEMGDGPQDGSAPATP